MKSKMLFVLFGIVFLFVGIIIGGSLNNDADADADVDRYGIGMYCVGKERVLTSGLRNKERERYMLLADGYGDEFKIELGGYSGEGGEEGKRAYEIAKFLNKMHESGFALNHFEDTGKMLAIFTLVSLPEVLEVREPPMPR